MPKSPLEVTREWRQKNPVKYIWHTAKQSAKYRGLAFDIEESDIVIPLLCPYLNVPITFTYGEGMVDTNASLDRMDNTKGYVKGNVEVISNLANRMKLSATKEQLVVFAKGVLSRYD